MHVDAEGQPDLDSMRFSGASATPGRHNRHQHLITLTGRRPRDAPGVPHLTKANLAMMVLRLAASTPVPAAEQAAKTFPIADYIVRVAQSKAHCVPRWNTVPPRRMRRMGCQQQTLCQMASTRGWPLHLRPNPPPTWSLDRSYCDRARTLRSLSDLELDSLVIFQRTAPTNLGIVDEEIFCATIGSDKAKALIAVEPFDGSLCHTRNFLMRADAEKHPAVSLYVAGKAYSCSGGQVVFVAALRFPRSNYRALDSPNFDAAPSRRYSTTAVSWQRLAPCRLNSSRSKMRRLRSTGVTTSSGATGCHRCPAYGHHDMLRRKSG
jgi:hypothetical protein